MNILIQFSTIPTLVWIVLWIIETDPKLIVFMTIAAYPIWTFVYSPVWKKFYWFVNYMEYNSEWYHDDVIKWKHFPRNWPFVREIHRSPVNFPHKGQWRGALMFSLIYALINDWVNNQEAGDLSKRLYWLKRGVWFLQHLFGHCSFWISFAAHKTISFKMVREFSWRIERYLIVSWRMWLSMKNGVFSAL